MPLPNEHSAIIREIGDFAEDTFRSESITEGIRIIIGKLKGATGEDDPMITHSYRFDADEYSEAEAKKWLEDNDIKYIKFEPATGEETEGEEEAMETVEIKKTENRKEFTIDDFKSGKMEDGSIFIEGYANTKNRPDRYGDVPTVFQAMRNYVYELKDFRKNPVLLLNHNNDTGSIAGTFSEKKGGYVYEDEVGLKFRAVFVDSPLPEVQHAKIVYSQGYGKALSIGGRWFYEDKDNPNALTYAEIMEISLVGIGADPNALTTKKNKDNSSADTANHQTDLTEDGKAVKVLTKANEEKIAKVSSLLSEAVSMVSEVVDELKKEEEKICQPKLLKKRFRLLMKSLKV